MKPPRCHITANLSKISPNPEKTLHKANPRDVYWPQKEFLFTLTSYILFAKTIIKYSVPLNPFAMSCEGH